jgi:N-carbamoyl-L-amino-acid hydrolase
MAITLEDLNRAQPRELADRLRGTYEHSPWIVERACEKRPFATLAALKRALVDVVRDAGDDAQLALIRAHPQRGGQAMRTATLTR